MHGGQRESYIKVGQSALIPFIPTGSLMYKYFYSKPNDSYKKMRPDMFWADLSDAYIGLDDFRGIDGKNYSYLYFCHSIITI